MPKAIKDLLVLSFPVWGLVLLLAILSRALQDTDRGTPLIVLFGIVAPFCGVTPLLRTQGMSMGTKTVFFIVYCGVIAVAMFVVGWASLGAFGYIK